MNRPKQSKSISDLLNGEIISIPYEEEVEEICKLYSGGRYKQMASKIESFEEGQYLFFRYLKMYLDGKLPEKPAKGYYMDIAKIFDYKKMYEIYYGN